MPVTEQVPDASFSLSFLPSIKGTKGHGQMGLDLSR